MMTFLLVFLAITPLAHAQIDEELRPKIDEVFPLDFEDSKPTRLKAQSLEERAMKAAEASKFMKGQALKYQRDWLLDLSENERRMLERHVSSSESRASERRLLEVLDSAPISSWDRANFVYDLYGDLPIDEPEISESWRRWEVDLQTIQMGLRMERLKLQDNGYQDLAQYLEAPDPEDIERVVSTLRERSHYDTRSLESILKTIRSLADWDLIRARLSADRLKDRNTIVSHLLRKIAGLEGKEYHFDIQDPSEPAFKRFQVAIELRAAQAKQFERVANSTGFRAREIALQSDRAYERTRGLFQKIREALGSKPHDPARVRGQVANRLSKRLTRAFSGLGILGVAAETIHRGVGARQSARTPRIRAAEIGK